MMGRGPQDRPVAADPAEVDPTLAPEVERAARTGARKFLILVAVAVVLFVAMQWSGLDRYFHERPENLAGLADGGWRAALVFVVLTAGLMAVGTPRLLFYVLGGMVFGFWVGLLLSLCGSLLGSYIAFRALRWGGQSWFLQRFGHHRFLRHAIEAQPTVLSVALVRCLPVSNAVINVGLALSRVGHGAFLGGTLIGFLPQGVLAVLIGSGVAEDTPGQGAVQLGVAALIALTIFVWSSRRKKLRNEENHRD